jgi:prolyl-tRNA synthetase
VVEASTGLIGGKESHEFMVTSQIGEDVLVFCGGCGYGANVELEQHCPSRRFGGDSSKPLEEVHTPGMVSIEDVASFLDTTPDAVLKCVMYVVGTEVVAVFVPGYRDVSEAKLARALGTEDFHVMRDDEREMFPALTPGFTGPAGLAGVRMLFDLEVRGKRAMVTGANRPDYHYRGAEEGRDFIAEPLADVAGPVAGDLCPAGNEELQIARGIEIGHIFKLGLKYSEVLSANFTDIDGQTKPMVMGTYGIGTSRMLQTVVEQHNDDWGIRWPKAVAPLPVEIIIIATADGGQPEAADRIEGVLMERGIEPLVDDRDVSPGIKFNDADLVGLPVQLIIGKKLPASGNVELKTRYTGERRDVPVGSALEEIERAIQEAP